MTAIAIERPRADRKVRPYRLGTDDRAAYLFLAPWLTMVCRSAIAGTVFALTIPGVLLVAGELFGVAKYGHGPGMEAFRMAFAWSGTLGVCAIGAVMSWWLFMRLEAIEGPGQDVQLPQWLQGGTPKP